jgi:hypothetical protein
VAPRRTRRVCHGAKDAPRHQGASRTVGLSEDGGRQWWPGCRPWQHRARDGVARAVPMDRRLPPAGWQVRPGPARPRPTRAHVDVLRPQRIDEVSIDGGPWYHAEQSRLSPRTWGRKIPGSDLRLPRTVATAPRHEPAAAIGDGTRDRTNSRSGHNPTPKSWRGLDNRCSKTV